MKMITLKVDLNDQTYPLFIGRNILANLAEVYKLYGHKSRAAVITDFKNDNCYFKIVSDQFKNINIEILPIYIAAQQIKDGLLPVQQIANRLVAAQFQADETIISLGGSYVGNISAFVAQMLYGGVAYFQIPTTLTAQVVQSIDPFCHTNFGSALNLFSIKYKRKLVWSDVVLIKSLPAQNLTSGLAHIIQLACQQDIGLFEFLEENLTAIFDLNLTVIEDAIIRCCHGRIDMLRRHHGELKNQQQKNFGEFFASILMESTQNKLKFGEALLFGMLIEATIAFRTGILDGIYFERFFELLKQVPYHHVRSQIDRTKVIEYLNDKISHHKLPQLHLPQKFGTFVSFNTYKLSDFLAAFDLIFFD